MKAVPLGATMFPAGAQAFDAGPSRIIKDKGQSTRGRIPTIEHHGKPKEDNSFLALWAIAQPTDSPHCWKSL
jgi:hypothetical protein